MSDLKDAAHNLTGQPEILDQDFRTTLDPVYFKAHKDFKTAFAAAAKDDDDEKCDPFDKKDQEFAKLCFEHALATGKGLHDWVRAVYHTARDALSREIKDQTQSVRRGDIFGLLRAIQLSVNQLELFDPTQLDAAFAKCTMDGEGNNDLMTYLSALKRFVDRLTTVKLPPTEQRKTYSTCCSPASTETSSRTSSTTPSARPTPAMRS